MASPWHVTIFAKIYSIPRCGYRGFPQDSPKPRGVPHRSLRQSTRPSKDMPTNPGSPSPKPKQHTENPSLPSFSLLQQIREARPAVRYTVYAGLGLMATVETTFWFNVLRAKFFPRASDEEKSEDEELLHRLRDAMKGYRYVWMRNYGRYYGAYVWGLGYGGLDGLWGDGG
jgi:hypothetical protein